MTAHHPLKGVWIRETTWHPPAPQSGATIMQRTSHTKMATNIYCEDPYCSAKCGRIVVMRSDYVHPSAPAELWVLDLNSQMSVMVESDITMRGLAQHAYADFFFYLKQSGKTVEMMRLCLSALETAPVWTVPEGHPGFVLWGSMSPDSRYYVNKTTRSPENQEVVVLDLETGKETVIAEGHDVFNPHPRFDRMNGENVLVQQNRGARMTANNTQEKYDPDIGATLFLVRRDGSDHQELPVSKPHLPCSISGHEAWVRGKPEFVFSCDIYNPYDDGNRVGNMLRYRIGDALPTVLAHAPDTSFGHVSSSYCGRYWVVDGWKGAAGTSHLEGPWVVIGSMTSGKFAVLCDVEGPCTRYEHGHAHPYMTADNRWATFVSTRTGTPQVYSAEIPEGFLEALN